MLYHVKKIKCLYLASVLLLIIFGSISKSMAQVQIAPVAVYLDEENRTGRIAINNPSSQPVELTMEMLYGYPATNTEGNVYLKTFDEVPENEPSAVEWIRIYPRHLVLPPGEQQTVRFSARPPQNLPQGEYWARPAISARSVNNQNTAIGEDINAQLTMVRRTILSVNYRQGDVRTGVDITDLSILQEDGSLVVEASLERTGNAAYLGTVDIAISDEAGNLRKEVQKEIAVYYNQNRSFELESDNLPPGTYTAEVSLNTGQRAEDNRAILEASPVSETIEFIIK